MNYPKNRIVVLDIAGQTAIVVCDNPITKSSLLTLGFTPDNGRMVRRIAEDSDRQQLVRSLVDLNALFSSGRDWSPAELIDLYREQGVVTSSYQIVSWKGPDDYLIIQR